MPLQPTRGHGKRLLSWPLSPAGVERAKQGRVLLSALALPDRPAEQHDEQERETRSSLKLIVFFTLGALALAVPDLADAQAVARVEYGSPPSAFEPRPASGIGAIVVGAGALLIGVENLVTLPLCYADFYPFEKQPCVIASTVVAGAALAVGIPSLALGLRRRAKYKEWGRRQRSQAALRPLSFWGDSHGAGLRYGLRF